MTFLGSYSFHGCTGFKELVLPDSVLQTGYGAFNLDCSLESVRLPKNLEILSPYLFMNCTSLTNVILGSECWCIMNEVFSNCMELKKITIPEKMEYFAGDVFAYCDALEQMDFEGWPPEFVAKGSQNQPYVNVYRERVGEGEMQCRAWVDSGIVKGWFVK